MDFYKDSKGAPHYIKMVKKYQAQAQRSNLPISNDVLVTTSNRAMVATNNYPDETKSWNKLAHSERTCPSGN